MFATIDDLRSQLEAPARDPAYAAKMLHDVPDGDVVGRIPFVLERVRGKRVLEFGASGQLHAAMLQCAAAVAGVDLQEAPGVMAFDLDIIGRDLPESDLVPEVIVCGEVLEHLANPGYFLHRLRRQYGGIPVIITVPNAFAKAGRKSIEKGVEMVNREHVAWYSYVTLTGLLARYGYTVREFYWYHGDPYTAEGLIVVAD